MSDTWAYAAQQMVKRFNVKIIPLKEIKKGDKWILQPCASFAQTEQQWIAENPGKKVTKLFATQCPEVISEWATRFPAYGVVAGNDTLIIDVDVVKGKRGKDAIAWLHDHGLPKVTFTVQTPSTGHHLYYHRPTYLPVQTGVCVDIEHPDVAEYYEMLNGDLSGIDTRFGNAFAIGPMSVKKAGMYTVLDYSDRAVIPVGLKIGPATSPVELKSQELIIKDTGERFYRTEPVPSGERNDYARDFTCWLASQNLSQSAVVAELHRLHTLVQGGVTPEEIQSLYDRILKKIGDDPFQYYINRFHECDYEKLRGWFDIETQEAHSHGYYKQRYNNDKICIDDNGKTKKINPFDLLQCHSAKKIVDKLGYFPGKPAMFDDPDWGAVANVCIPWSVDMTLNETIEVDVYVDAFKQVFENIFGDHGQAIMMWFIAALFVPSVRSSWSLYILSKEQGLGKDLILEILFSLFGDSNSLIGADIKLFTSRFNSILTEKSIIAFSDFPKIVSSEHRNETKSQIKKITTALRLTTEKKGWEHNEAPIYSRYIFTNNDMSAMELDHKDRRFYVINSRATPLDDMTYTYAGLCHRKDEMALSSAHRAECRKRIIKWFYEACNATVQDCVEFVRARPPVTADKKQIQVISENLRLVKTRQAIASGLEAHEGAAIPSYRGDSIFYSSVVTEGSLRAFLTFEIGQKSTSVERYIHELEDEGIIERLRYGEHNVKTDKPRWLSTVQMPREIYWMDNIDMTMHRTVQGPSRHVKCWVVCDLWAYNKPDKILANYKSTDFSQEYRQLFISTRQREPMVIDDGRGPISILNEVKNG